MSEENKTAQEIKNWISDNGLLQELYSISATLDGLRGYYQPEYNKHEFREMVINDLEAKINEIAFKIKYRIDKNKTNVPEQSV